MKPHLIVLDLDGTLLTDQQQISANTKNIIAGKRTGPSSDDCYRSSLSCE